MLKNHGIYSSHIPRYSGQLVNCLQAGPTPPAGRRVGGGGRGDGGREREGRKKGGREGGGGGGRGEPGRGEGAGGRDGRVGGGLRGGVGDTVRNQRREEHLRRKQNRLLNIASNTRGRISPTRTHLLLAKCFATSLLLLNDNLVKSANKCNHLKKKNPSHVKCSFKDIFLLWH